MKTEQEFEELALSYLFKGGFIPLTEQQWVTFFKATEPGPFSVESHTHQFGKSAYKRIKHLELQANRMKGKIELLKSELDQQKQQDMAVNDTRYKRTS